MRLMNRFRVCCLLTKPVSTVQTVLHLSGCVEVICIVNSCVFLVASLLKACGELVESLSKLFFTS